MDVVVQQEQHVYIIKFLVAEVSQVQKFIVIYLSRLRVFEQCTRFRSRR